MSISFTDAKFHRSLPLLQFEIFDVYASAGPDWPAGEGIRHNVLRLSVRSSVHSFLRLRVLQNM